MFNHNRLILARKRRRLSAKALAELAGVTPVTVSRIEKSVNPPDESTVGKLAKALGYPLDFFYQDELEPIQTEAVSFRSLTKMTAKERDAALTAGTLGLQLIDWVEERFSLPDANLLDLSYETSPEVAAMSLRQHWGLGLKPISNIVHLLESQGVRFLSLSESTASVDAFSFWRNSTPYIFLNNFKTAEHSIFDAAHELGHLVLHKHGGTGGSREAEREANAFASSFLMPRDDVVSRMPGFISTDVVIKAKSRWRVSAMAMAYRLHSVSILSDWQYKSICIELGRRGYRSGEPIGIEREKSAIWLKVLSQLWSEKITKAEIADQLSWPLDEIEGLIVGLTGHSAGPQKKEKRNAKLEVV
ncbi:helix-turn-helix domain-containing protein [Vreelandella venusta]|uniref:helix-turn-helix domain-containing protein n=1 Tax=Vreelandella venusta TaxID=44935 RepID=UPI0018DA94E0|nr:ImmA/IrrE family metallo-endopeptidase [Halomonas venusta]QPI65854.1 ImmA/IrrE family metallo-endopeptidase [Halomonas venusta]UQI42494.1 ImmA/IrrE family metallo-endopeptidase [Halomonas venusta]